MLSWVGGGEHSKGKAHFPLWWKVKKEISWNYQHSEGTLCSWAVGIFWVLKRSEPWSPVKHPTASCFVSFTCLWHVIKGATFYIVFFYPTVYLETSQTYRKVSRMPFSSPRFCLNILPHLTCVYTQTLLPKPFGTKLQTFWHLTPQYFGLYS